jgi:hypothetical protein
MGFDVIEIEKVVGQLMRLDGLTTLDELKQPVLPAQLFNFAEPDLLLGIDEYLEIIQGQASKLTSGFSICQTKLGPIICGCGRTDGQPGTLVSSSTLASTESSATMATPMLLAHEMATPFVASMVQVETYPLNHTCPESKAFNCASKGVKEPTLLQGNEEGKREAQPKPNNARINTAPNICQPKKALSNVNNRSRSVQACPLPVLGKRHQSTKRMETINSANVNEATPAYVRRKTFRRREYFAISRRREGHPTASKLSDEDEQEHQ